MAMTRSRYKELSAGVLVCLTPEERAQLRQGLFDKGNVSLQSFFRQVALREIQAAHARARGANDDHRHDDDKTAA
jgi:hypothetical protein